MKNTAIEQVEYALRCGAEHDAAVERYKAAGLALDKIRMETRTACREIENRVKPYSEAYIAAYNDMSAASIAWGEASQAVALNPLNLK